MKFMLMMHAPRGTGEWEAWNWPVEAQRALVSFMRRLTSDLSDSGELVAAEGLAEPKRARVVRAGKDGAPEVTDGPFAEAKEFLAGWWIVDVETPRRAYEIAARASAAPGPGGGGPLNIAIEVREVMSTAPVEL